MDDGDDNVRPQSSPRWWRSDREARSGAWLKPRTEGGGDREADRDSKVSDGDSNVSDMEAAEADRRLDDVDDEEELDEEEERSRLDDRRAPSPGSPASVGSSVIGGRPAPRSAAFKAAALAAQAAARDVVGRRGSRNSGAEDDVDEEIDGREFQRRLVEAQRRLEETTAPSTRSAAEQPSRRNHHTSTSVASNTASAPARARSSRRRSSTAAGSPAVGSSVAAEARERRHASPELRGERRAAGASATPPPPKKMATTDSAEARSKFEKPVPVRTAKKAGAPPPPKSAPELRASSSPTAGAPVAKEQGREASPQRKRRRKARTDAPPGDPAADRATRDSVSAAQTVAEDRPQATATKASPRKPEALASEPVDNVFMVRAPSKVAPASLAGSVPAPRAVGPALMARLQEVTKTPSVLEELKAAVLSKLQSDDNLVPNSADREVLADYISVLVEQRKSREEIAVELEPFVGTRATPFAIWVETCSRDILAKRRNANSAPRIQQQQQHNLGPGLAQQRPTLRAQLTPNPVTSSLEDESVRSAPADTVTSPDVVNDRLVLRPSVAATTEGGEQTSKAQQKKIELLAQMTGKLQEILKKLADKNLDDQGRDKYQSLAQTIQSQLNALSR